MHRGVVPLFLARRGSPPSTVTFGSPGFCLALATFAPPPPMPTSHICGCLPFCSLTIFVHISVLSMRHFSLYTQVLRSPIVYCHLRRSPLSFRSVFVSSIGYFPFPGMLFPKTYFFCFPLTTSAYMWSCFKSALFAFTGFTTLWFFPLMYSATRLLLAGPRHVWSHVHFGRRSPLRVSSPHV